MKKHKRLNRKHLINHAKKSLRLRLRFKEIKRNKRRRLIGLNKNERLEISLKNKFKDYVHIKAPSDFSMTTNTNDTISFISKLEKCFEKKQKVFVDLTDIQKIADGAIVVLLSSMSKFKSHKIDFNGNFPLDPIANKAIKDSGFFEQLYKHRIGQSDKYNLSTSRIFTHANKKVDQLLSSEIIQNVSKKIWGEEKRCTGLQRVFIELMQNTNNHASLIQKGEHHWWVSVSYDKNENKACFSFIDYGVGIIKSIKTDPKSKFFKFKEQIKELFNPNTDAEMLQLLLQGKIHSSTGKYYRGKGLPGIFDASMNNKISNLVVISNKGYADVSNNEYKILNNEFTGTFVYWELNYTNERI